MQRSVNSTLCSKTTETDLAICFAGYCTICGLWIPIMNFFSYAWVVLREGKKAIILHVPCFRLFSPSPVATDKTVGTGWDWIALSQTLAKIEENPYHLNKLKPNPRAPEYRLSIGSTIQN